MEGFHPRLKARGTRRPGNPVRTIVYAPATDRTRFIENELARESKRIAHSASEVVTALVDEPAPRPQVLVIDVDHVPLAELLHLHAIREHWFGAIIALGRVPPALRRSLGITTTVFPLVEDALRDALADIKFEATTIRCPVIGDAE